MVTRRKVNSQCDPLNKNSSFLDFDIIPILLSFQEPNPEDPLNKEAAEILQNNRRLFEQNVAKAMRGGYVGSTYFERCLK